MISLTYFNRETNIDEVWYESSSILYSKYLQDTGDLFVVFKGGGQYVYHKVPMATSYLMFKHGNYEGSQGKSLNKFIKGEYEFEKLDNIVVSDLDLHKLEIEKIVEEERKRNITYFISGHREISQNDFNKYYKYAINDAIAKASYGPNPMFIMGDYCGCDIMAQNYLIDELEYDPDLITVYHMFDSPRNVNPKVKNLKGGFESDEERDAQMTKDSFEDIAFVKDHLKLSGTAMNILRRKKM